MLLSWVVWICVSLTAVWILLAIYDWWRRKNYNLTTAERASTATTPDFLKVDHEKRREALERGRPRSAGAEAVEAPQRTKLSGAAGMAATFFAVLTLIVAAIKAINDVEAYSEMASNTAAMLTDAGRIEAMIRDFWPGLLIALAVILVQVGRVVSVLRKT